MSGEKDNCPETEDQEKSYQGQTDIFLILTAVLLLIAAFAKYLCPYDPMRRI